MLHLPTQGYIEYPPPPPGARVVEEPEGFLNLALQSVDCFFAKRCASTNVHVGFTLGIMQDNLQTLFIVERKRTPFKCNYDLFNILYT